MCVYLATREWSLCPVHCCRFDRFILSYAYHWDLLVRRRFCLPFGNRNSLFLVHSFPRPRVNSPHPSLCFFPLSVPHSRHCDNTIEKCIKYSEMKQWVNHRHHIKGQQIVVDSRRNIMLLWGERPLSFDRPRTASLALRRKRDTRIMDGQSMMPFSRDIEEINCLDCFLLFWEDVNIHTGTLISNIYTRFRRVFARL